MVDNTTRVDELKRKLAARRDRPGFKNNVAAIEAEIARLEAEDAAAQGS